MTMTQHFFVAGTERVLRWLHCRLHEDVAHRDPPSPRGQRRFLLDLHGTHCTSILCTGRQNEDSSAGTVHTSGWRSPALCSPIRYIFHSSVYLTWNAHFKKAPQLICVLLWIAVSNFYYYHYFCWTLVKFMEHRVILSYEAEFDKPATLIVHTPIGMIISHEIIVQIMFVWKGVVDYVHWCNKNNKVTLTNFPIYETHINWIIFYNIEGFVKISFFVSILLSKFPQTKKLQYFTLALEGAMAASTWTSSTTRVWRP